MCRGRIYPARHPSITCPRRNRPPTRHRPDRTPARVPSNPREPNHNLCAGAGYIRPAILRSHVHGGIGHRLVIVLIIRPRACLPTRVNPTTIYVQGPDISGPPYFDNMPTVESATDCIRTSLPRRGRFPHRSGWGEVVPSVSGGYDASCPRRVRSGTLCVVSPRSFTSGARCFTRSSARLTFAGGLRL